MQDLLKELPVECLPVIPHGIKNWTIKVNLPDNPNAEFVQVGLDSISLLVLFWHGGGSLVM